MVAPKLLIGGAIGLTAPPPEFRPHRLAKKIAAGADFVTSQLVFDINLLKRYMKRIQDFGLVEKRNILIGVGALASAGMAHAIDKYPPGVVVPEPIIKRLEGIPKKKQKEEGIKIVVEQIQELMEIPGISGIDLMDLQPETWFPTVEIVERAGLLDRPSL
jgi:methylenetetrahydrofolate reductase (NADPH)